jgi:AraC-like DNA-binding protein
MPPTVHVAALDHLRALLHAQGVDADAVLRHVGISDPTPGPRVLRGPYLEAKAEAARRLADVHLGLRLGLASRLDAFGLFGAVVSHARTLREALHRGVGAVDVWEQGTEVRLEAHAGGARVHYRNLHGRSLARRIDGDQTIVFLARAAREVSAAPAEEVALGLASDAPSDAPLRRAVSAVGRVEYSASGWSLHIAGRALDRPLLPIHPAARHVLDEELSRALQALRPSGDLRARLDAVLRRRIDGPCALRTVATELGVSSRSLQERLEALGTTFGAERDRQREAVARELLHDATLSVSEVARRVGFASTPGFSRFIRRRTGEAASRLRGHEG